MADDSYEKQTIRLGNWNPSHPDSVRSFLCLLEADLIRQPTHEAIRLWLEKSEGRWAIRGWAPYPSAQRAVERRLAPCREEGYEIEIRLLPTGALEDPGHREALFARSGKPAIGRGDPDFEAAVVHLWEEESLIRPLHRLGEWVLCQSETGYLGWVEGGSLSLRPASEGDFGETAITAEALEKWIEPWLGTPYVWGGTGRKGIDCSGFSQAVLKPFGAILPRDAHQH